MPVDASEAASVILALNDQGRCLAAVSDRPRSTEAVWKRKSCVATQCRHVDRHSGEFIAATLRHARVHRVFSNAASEMRWQTVLWGVLRSERGAYALIACISGLIPMICMTRLRL